MTDPERDLATEFASCKDELERALAYSGGSHDLQDVYEGVQDGRLQLWLAPHSVMVTEILKAPKTTTLHFFLSAGRMDELEAMLPAVIEWGKVEMKCDRASLMGRPGWSRSFLTKKNGWQATHIVMTKEI